MTTEHSNARFPLSLEKRIRNWLDVGASVAVTVTAVIAIAFMLRSWPSSAPSRPLANAMVEASPSALVARVELPEGAATLGDVSAPLAIIEYADFQCPYCATFARETLPQLKAEYVKSGKALLAFRHLPLPIHAHAMDAAVSADCAGQQGRFWQMHDLLFSHSDKLQASTGHSLAASLGLSVAAFDECETSDRSATNISRDQETAISLRLNATPTFVIGQLQPDRSVKVDTVIPGAPTFERIRTVLDDLLRGTNGHGSDAGDQVRTHTH